MEGEKFRLRSANSSNEARLDICARGFWSRGKRAFFDVRVFYPFAPSNLRDLPTVHKEHENEKRRTYSERIMNVEQGDFTPLIFSSKGSIDKDSECSRFYSRLAELLAAKRNEPKSTIVTWLRCRLSFCLLRSSLICLRGSRTGKRRIERLADIAFDVATDEANIRPMDRLNN